MASLRAGKKASSIGNSLTIKTKKEMKKNLFMVAAVALMALVSCNKEEITNNENIAGDQIETPSDIVFVAEFDQEPDTKIALGDLVDGVRKTTWEAKDKISINGVEFTAKAAGERTEFTTSASFDETATVFRAVYPATSYRTNAVEIPNAQDGTFASATIAVAESSTTSLKFNNLATILKFQVPVNCTKVTFVSTKEIAGRVSVEYKDGVMTPNYESLTMGNQTINVTGTFVPGTDYYVAVKPGTHTFTVKIDDEVSKASTKAVTVERSKIHNLGVLPVPAPPTTIYFIPGQWASDNAWFAVAYGGAAYKMEIDDDGYYRYDIPGHVTAFGFWRMNPNSNDLTEANRWNDIADVQVPQDENVYYTWVAWDKPGTWGPKPAEKTFSIVGEFNSWGSNGDDIAMEKISGGIYAAKNISTIEAFSKWKIRVNNAWEESYSSSITGIEANRWVAVGGSGDTSHAVDGAVDIYIDIKQQRIYVMATGKDYATATEQTSSTTPPPAGIPADPNALYLKPNSNWTQANARFAAYFFGNGETWVSMTDSNGDGIYEVQKPTNKNYPNVIFCRMNPSASANNWNNKWNQTADLTVPTDGNNLYTVKDGTWDKGGGTWTKQELF